MRRKCLALFLCIVFAGSILTGCGQIVRVQNTPINNTKLSDTAKEAVDEAVEVETLDSDYVTGLNEFAYRIFSKLNGEENVFISPYSISMALSMLYNGADGASRKELAELLGYNKLTDYSEGYSEAANQYMNSNSKYMIEALQEIDPKVQVNVANSIWLADQVKFNDTIESALLAPVREYYNADIFKVDFTVDKTLDQLNEWVSDKTDGMIDPFLEELSNKEALRLLLVNAIYFNGKWSNPFSPDDTREQTFYGSDSVSKVDMMYMYDSTFRYYSEDDLRAIEIPYGNGSVVMDVFLPEDKQNNTIKKVYSKLTNDEISKYTHKLDQAGLEEITTLALPKFELEYGLKELNDTLKELGMVAAFGPDPSDFSLIGDNLLVNQVVHKAKIQVEEWGTKASAATGISVGFTAIMEEEPLEFIADVPFVFFIRDKASDTILFMGEIDQLN